MVDKSTIWVGPFSDEAGIAAAQWCHSEPLPLLSAKTLADSLGYDPLLIALHGSGDSNPEPTAVIKAFLQQRLEGLAEGTHIPRLNMTVEHYYFLLYISRALAICSGVAPR